MNNLNKKTIIQIIIIIVAFGGSGFLLYNSMFKKQTAPASLALPTGIATGMPTAVATAEGKILPYGNTLNFDAVLNKQNLIFGIITYPKLDPGQEVGVSEEDLIKVTPKQTVP